MQASCFDCGLPYDDMGVDLVLPDQQWKVLFPEESGLLCANCICRRAQRLGASSLLSWADRLDHGKEEVEEKQSRDFRLQSSQKERKRKIWHKAI